MKATKILAAAVFATFAAAAYAQQYGPGTAGCIAGATPGSANCPAYGAGPEAGYGRHGAGMLERLKAADTDANGLISLEEAQAFLKKVFVEIDANGDGNVSLVELQAAHQARAGGTRGQGWTRWDADHDGKLSQAEVANAPRLAAQFTAIDTNSDGFLTAEELQAAHARFAGRGPRH